MTQVVTLISKDTGESEVTDTRPVVVAGASSDLGRGLLGALDRARMPSVAIGRSPPAQHRPELRRVVAAPTLAASCAVLAGIVSEARIVVNCAGMAARAQYSPAELDRSFKANVLFALSLGVLGDRVGVPVIHASTGLLDFAEYPADLSAAELDAVAVLTSALAPSAMLGRVADKLAGASPAAASHPYLAHKLVLERLLGAALPGSRALRISNYFGPGCLQPRLIPRLIEGRIRGTTQTLADHWRNYSYVDELNDFLLALITCRDILPGPVIWAYGHHDVTCSMIVTEIARALPTCYGTAIVRPAEGSGMPQVPAVPRFSSYFPTLRSAAVPMSDAILRTADFWRDRIHFAPPDFIKQDFSHSRISGGSVAVKRFGPRQRGLFVKTATIMGYEGGGIPKVAAELAFYQRMPRGLRELYPRWLGGQASPVLARIIIAAHGDGRTVADTVVDGAPVPEQLIRELVSQAFARGYLDGLRVIENRRQRERYFRSYYTDRAIGRLRSMLDMLRRERLGRDASALVQMLGDGDPVPVNGQLCANPFALLQAIGDRPPNPFLPRTEGPCAHGDMTILNMLWTGEGRLLLIDPRGVLGSWDPVYDLGKLAFSLSGFAHCIKGQLSWDKEDSAHYRIVDSSGTLAAATGSRGRLDSWLLSDPQFSPLREAEPDLGRRVAFAEATHYLADAPYRYAQGRDVDRAIVTLLLGVECLHRTCSDEV